MLAPPRKRGELGGHGPGVWPADGAKSSPFLAPARLPSDRTIHATPDEQDPEGGPLPTTGASSGAWVDPSDPLHPRYAASASHEASVTAYQGQALCRRVLPTDGSHSLVGSTGTGETAMLVEPLLERIEIEPEVMLGKPVIRGTRITVEIILEKIAAGCLIEGVLAEYPCLARDDVLAAVAYARQAIGPGEFIPRVRGRG